METAGRIAIALADGVADVRFTRADKLNALDMAQFEAVVAAVDTLAAMPGLRCVVLSGEGRAFCAGIDLALLAEARGMALAPRTHGLANLLQQAAWGWRTLPVPVIAAIHGQAFGAGLQIALGADVRIAHPDAQLAIMEARWGLVPDLGGIALLRGLVRDDHARALTYTARCIGAVEARAIGLVTQLADDPHAKATALAHAIAAASPAATRAAKRLFALSPDADAATILRAESDEQATLLAGPDVAEALAAAREKRTARLDRQDG